MKRLFKSGKLLISEKGEMDVATTIILAFILGVIATYMLQQCSIN